jgi:hypothetical protein
VAPLSVSASDKSFAPNGLQTFVKGGSGSTTVTFVNVTGEEVKDLELSLVLPKKWKASILGSKDRVRKVGYAVAPGQAVVVTFNVKAGKKAFNGAKKLAKLSFKGKNLKTVGAGAFKGGPAKPKVGAPKAKKAAYKKLLEKGGLSKKAIYS